MQSHIRKVYACLAVICRLRFWQDDRGLLRATAVIRGWNGYQNKSQHMVINFRKQETNIPLTCIFIYTVQTKLVQCIPPSSKLSWGKKKQKNPKEKKCVIYFVHCLYFRRRHFKPKSLKRQDSFCLFLCQK